MRPLALLLLAALAACGAKAPAAGTAGWEDCASLPALTGRVSDRAHLLRPDVERRLTARLATIEAKTSDQLVVVTVPSLEGHSILEAAVRMGRCWGVGRKGIDNGVLLLVAPAERQTRIDVGYGLEGLLKDEVAGAIIREAMLPAFRQGRFEEGIEAGTERIATVLESDSRRPRRLPPPAKG